MQSESKETIVISNEEEYELAKSRWNKTKNDYANMAEFDSLTDLIAEHEARVISEQGIILPPEVVEALNCYPAPEND